MHRFDARLVPVTYLLALLTIFTGNTLQLSGVSCCLRNRKILGQTGSIIKLVGSVLSATASATHLIADIFAKMDRDREGVTADTIDPIINALADRDHEGVPVPVPVPATTTDIDPALRALDFPAAFLQFSTSFVLLGSNTCAVIAVFNGDINVANAARILLLVASSIGLVSTTLHFSSEVHRTLDVAILVRALRRELAGLPIIDSPTRAAAVTRTVNSFDFHHSLYLFSFNFIVTAFSGADFVDFLASISPLVMGSVFSNICASATLLAGAIINSYGHRLAALIVLEISFSLFIMGVILVLTVGAAKVSHHRRGGRRHLLYDVNKALRRL